MSSTYVPCGPREPCLLSTVCGDQDFRTPALVKRLLLSGHSANGIDGRPDRPMTALLRKPGEHAEAIFQLLLDHGADVLLGVPTDPGATIQSAIWVEVLRTGKVAYVERMIQAGWNPAAWATWKQGEEPPPHPLSVLENYVAGTRLNLWAPSDRLAREHQVSNLLSLLVEKGFDPMVPSKFSTVHQIVWSRPWFQAWYREHEAKMLHEAVPRPEESIKPNPARRI